MGRALDTTFGKARVSVAMNTIHYSTVGVFSPQVIPLLGPATDTVCYQLGWVGMNSFGFSVWFGISICGANSAKIQNRLRPFLNFVIQNYFLCGM
jgi:hypothetical protein